jgi:methyltransferase (TIGR00027 family)
MNNTINSIQHVSDTALWIAMYRARESKRPDAVFKDQLAEKLAGDRGAKMVASTPHSEAMAFAMVVRTAAIDRLIEKAFSLNIDTVINLGAGLDTRPYRMQLPATLRWVEVDFSGIMDYKEYMLKDESPLCILNRIASDLSNDVERKKLFTQLSKETKNALIITEGVIGYLTKEQAMKLSQDLFEIPSFKYWIQDYSQGKMRKNKQSKDVSKSLTNTPWQFDVKNPINFFSEQGWKPKENIFMLDEADRIGRPLPLMFPWNILMKLFPSKIRDLANKTYGYVMFNKE